MVSISVGSQSLSTAAVGSAVARDPFSVAGLLAVFAVVQSTGADRWTVFAAVLLGGAVFLPSTIAFVAGQFALIPAVTIDDQVAIAVAQIALLIVLTEPARDRSVPVVIGATAVAYAGLLGVIAVGLRDGLLVAGGLLCLSVALGTYLVHRVTLVRLGMVDAEAKE